MGPVPRPPAADRAGAVMALRAEVERFLASCRDPVLVEPGEEPFALSSGSGLQLSTRGALLLLEGWDESRTLARRVAGVRRRARACLELEVERFGGRRGALVLADRAEPAAAASLARASRGVLLEQLRRWLARQYPGWRLRELTAGMDLENTLSPACPRALLELGSRRLAAVAGWSGARTGCAHSGAALARPCPPPRWR